MQCPLCGSRKARRSCPAVGEMICAVCCGTKRLIEIACPSNCVYLMTAREHPAAVVKRQQERDVAALLPTVQALTERQQQLFLWFQALIARHKPEGFVRLVDDDVAEAAAVVAATLETAERGVIYDHRAQSAAAQKLAEDIKGMLEQVQQQRGKIYKAEVALVLRAIEKGARDTRTLMTGDGDTAYLKLMARLLRENEGFDQPAAPEKPQSPLIIP